MEGCYLTDSDPRPIKLHSARSLWNPVQPLARRGGRDDHESNGGLTRAVEKRTSESLPDCEHLNLELEWNDFGYSTGHYTCIICGEPVVHAPQESVSR